MYFQPQTEISAVVYAQNALLSISCDTDSQLEDFDVLEGGDL